jgi:tRNA(fMet)-specific endonuclease VapC
MAAYLLDTNHASAVVQGHLPLLRRISRSRGSHFGLSMPTIGELWFMIYNSRQIQANTEKLQRVLRAYHHWEFDAGAAEDFGRIRAETRRAGRPIPELDVQIAAIARVNDLTLLTSDRHFAHVIDLQVENWLH